MAEEIGGLPFSTIRFDQDGDLESGAESALLASIAASGTTDLLVMGHGWNNDQVVADHLFRGFYQAFPDLLGAHGVAGRQVGLVGVIWPSQRWSDEPIPDFRPAGSVDLAGSGGGAADFAAAGSFPAPPPPDAGSAAATRSAFDAEHAADVGELLDLLKTRPDSQAGLDRARAVVRTLAAAASATSAADGEPSASGSVLAGPDDQPNQLFEDFVAKLEEQSVVTGEQDGGAAGLGGSLGRLWHGAQEVARQLTYWQMKNRAGVVGQKGLGPLLARVHARHPQLGIDLIGHSFGARAVSYALKGVPVPAAGQSPVITSITLLEGAFSHFAFAGKLPFDASRSGALAGLDNRVAGPVVACYSRYDQAVGVFYPLASRAADEDAAGFDAIAYRWGGMGHDGHQKGAAEFGLNDAGTAYDFGGARLVNINAARVVKNGTPPSGAHSDICHPELAWVVLSAAGLV